MEARLGAALATIAALTAAAFLAAAPAGASHGSEIYCVNGLTTGLPVSIGYSGGSVTLGSSAVAHAIAANGGTFWVGFITRLGRGGLWVSTSPPPDGLFAPGFSTNTLSLGGPCTGGGPTITYLGVCKNLPRADGTTGLFQAIRVADWNDPTGQYFDAPAANWVEGLGLTCDNPLALGYKAAGYSVSWGGKRAPDHDVRGVRGSGFNDIYPYFTK